MKISKELVSEVLGINYDSIDIRNNVLYITYNVKKYFDGNIKEINLYEFIHKNCKEWALREEYWLTSGVQNRNEIANYDGLCLIKDFDHELEDFMKTGNSECEAIIKACEWILNENP